MISLLGEDVKPALGLASFILSHQLEGDVKEPVTLFEKSLRCRLGVMVYLTSAIIGLSGQGDRD